MRQNKKKTAVAVRQGAIYLRGKYKTLRRTLIILQETLIIIGLRIYS